MPSRPRGLAAIAAAVDGWAARLLPFARGVLLGPVLFGSMVGAGVWAIENPGILRRLDINRPSKDDVRNGLIHALLAAVAFLVLAGVVLHAGRRRGATTGSLEIMANLRRLLAPLSALPFIAMLELPGIEQERPRLTLLFIALAGVLCARGVYAFRPTVSGGAPSPWARRGETIARYGTAAGIAALWVGYACFFSRLSITNHHALRTRALDLGCYDNIFYQTIHGRPLGCSFAKGGTHSSAHFDPLLVLLSPLYLIHPRAELLLVLQSIWLGAGVVPVYLIARRTLESRGAGVVFAIAYVLYPALHGANLYEFHSLTLLCPLLLWMLYLLEAGAHRAYFALLFLSLFCREDVPLLLCFVGLYGLADARPRWVRAGWLTIAASVGYLLIIRTWFMPSGDFFNGGPRSYGYAFHYEGLIPHNRGVADVLSSLVTNPAFVVASVVAEPKILYVLLLFMPLGFLPFLARPGRVMLIFWVLYCLLATHAAIFSIYFHYAIIVVSVAFAIAPAGLRRATEGPLCATLGLDPRRLRRAMLAACLVTSALVSWKYGAIVENRAFHGATGPIARALTEAEKETYAWVDAAVRQIPPEATVAVTNRTGAHAASRMTVTFYRPGSAQDDVDYVFLDEADLEPQQLERHNELVALGALVEISRHDRMALLRRR